MKYIEDLTLSDVIVFESQEELNKLRELSEDAGYSLSLPVFLEMRTIPKAVRPKGEGWDYLENYIRKGFTVHKSQDFIKNNNKKQEKVMSNLKVVKSQVLNVKG